MRNPEIQKIVLDIVRDPKAMATRERFILAGIPHYRKHISELRKKGYPIFAVGTGYRYNYQFVKIYEKETSQKPRTSLAQKIINFFSHD
jgi:hypothetical protein